MPAGGTKSCALQYARDGETDPIPPLAMLLELAPAGGGEPIVLGAAAVLRRPPLGFQLAVFFQAVQRRKQRARIDPELIVAEDGEPLRDPVAVHRLAGKDRQVERALGDVELVHRRSFRRSI